MSSFANKVQKQQHEQPQQSQQTIQTVIVRKQKISVGELCLLCFLAIVMAVTGVKIISNQTAIYKVNKEIQHAEATIVEQTKVNEDLEVQVKELTEYERLWKKAEELGLKRNENNVKAVQQ